MNLPKAYFSTVAISMFTFWIGKIVYLTPSFSQGCLR
jgi:hypothetical protein